MNTKDAIAVIGQTLKENSFRKKGNATWNRSDDSLFTWVINLQKDKSATKGNFNMTVNVGVYIVGTARLIFNKDFNFIDPTLCFFRQRPRFFGTEKDFWNFDENSDNSIASSEMDQLIKDRIIPFLKDNLTFDRLVTYLPMEKWISNTNFHSEILSVAAGYFILGNYKESERLLRVVIDRKTPWAETAEKVLNLIL